MHLNPGQGRVSRLCHEPRVALAALHEMLAPFQASAQLHIMPRCRPVGADVEGDRVRAVIVRDDEDGEDVAIAAPYVLDATELGDVLPLAGVEHVTGAESQRETGEPHALPGEPDPLDQQAVTACLALDYLPGEDHTIERPADYDFWRSYRASFWPGPQLAWEFTDPVTLERRREAIFEEPGSGAEGLWTFRRIFYRGHYPPGRFASDITLVNWPQNDYWLGPLVGVSEEERQRHERGARQLSLAFLYWMQTEAPRLDGGIGYRGLRLRRDVVGTHDGLAKHVYVRESRRIHGEFTVLEQHIGVEARAGIEGAEPFFDSIGIGSYRLDLHPTTGQRTYVDIGSWPFQIPLGALIPIRVENLLAAGKNLSVTHITNGCYRMHRSSGTSARRPARSPRTACASARRRGRSATRRAGWRTSSGC